MITILVAYAALSVTFSLGFIAGAWWVARARIHGRSIKRNCPTSALVRQN